MEGKLRCSRLEHFTYKVKLKEPGLSNLGKTRLQTGLKSILPDNPINGTQAGSSQECMMEA